MATVNSPYAKSGILSDDDVLQGLQALLTASLAVSGPTSSADSVMTASLLGSNLGSPSNGGLSRSSVDMALLSHAPLSHTQPQGVPVDTHLWSRSQSLHRASIDSAFLARASKPQRKTSSKQKRLQLFKTMSLDLARAAQARTVYSNPTVDDRVADLQRQLEAKQFEIDTLRAALKMLMGDGAATSARSNSTPRSLSQA